MSTRLPLSIHLLGNFRLLAGATPISTINTPRLQSLLVYLLLHCQAPQSRQHIAFQFWPDSSEKQAHTNLRKLLFQLRNALPDPDQYLIQDHLTVQWRPDAPYTLDVAELTQALARLVRTPGKALASADPAALAQVVNLYQGELLPGCLDEWILPVRQQLQREVMGALEQLVSLSEHQREYRAGIRYAQRLLGIDPLHEGAYRRLMQLHALNGDRTAALHQYQICATRLQQELGVAPEEETAALYQRILKMDGKSALVTPPRFDAPLVGRTTEWRTLLAAWRQTQQGEAHFVAIAGEAGIGKSRLAEEFMVWVGAQGIRLARTRSYEAEGGLAFAPVTEWLRSPALKPTLAKLDKLWLSEVARLLPELLSEHVALAPPALLTEAWQRQRFFEALARAVLVEKAPLLLVIDDLQWCDSETLTWLRFLLRFDPHSRLLIVGTWRRAAVDEAHPLQTLLRDLDNANQLTTLELLMLTAEETADLAQQIANRPISTSEMQHLYAVTEGHPLFVVETVRSQGENHPQSLLSKVQNVIQSRLAQLSRSARDIVNVAAVIGRRFSLATLACVSQNSEATVSQILDELWQKHIFREQSADLYDFSHDRIREVVYQTLNTARRRQLHHQVAQVLELLYANKLDEISGELAAHYEQAGSTLKARSYWQRSGKRAATQFANSEAIQHLSKALILTDSDEHAMRFELLVEREAVYALQGQAEERFADLLTLQQISQQLLAQDSTQATPAIRSALLLGKYYQRSGRPEQTIISLQMATALAQQAGARALEAQAWSHLGNALFHQAKLAAAREALLQAIDCAEREQMSDVEASTYEFLAAVCMFSGAKATEIEGYLQRSLELYRQREDAIGINRVLNKLGYLPVAQGEGDYAQAKAYYQQGLQIARQSGHSIGESNILRNLGVLYTYRGDYQQALRYIHSALELERQHKDLHSEGVTFDYLAGVQMNMGEYDAAQESLATALNLLQQTKSGGWICKIWSDLSLLDWLQGAFAAARERAERAHKLASEVGDRRQVGYALTRLGRALQGLDCHSEAVVAFTQAYAIHQELAQYNRSMEPLAGMARSALAQQDYAKANQQAETMLAHLQSHQLDRTDEALDVYMTCYRVLVAMKDQRATAVLQQAHEQLQVRAATLEADNARQRFWSAPLHATVDVEMGQNRG